MKKFFEARPGRFISVDEISRVNAQLANYEKNRNEWCVCVWSGRDDCVIVRSKTLSGEDAVKLASKLVSLLTDDETKVISLPEFTER